MKIMYLRRTLQYCVRIFHALSTDTEILIQNTRFRWRRRLVGAQLHSRVSNACNLGNTHAWYRSLERLGSYLSFCIILPVEPKLSQRFPSACPAAPPPPSRRNGRVGSKSTPRRTKAGEILERIDSTISIWTCSNLPNLTIVSNDWDPILNA